ncbi:MAG TPA: putative glycolipid-binding domain-containing protein [Longimicrobium sp.]|nr:putative glycolipid-binding domain-containing protein [Longimicrobium sp.]
MTVGTGRGDEAREAVWRRMDTHSLEYLRWMDGPDGPRLEGTVVYAGEGGPLEARYAVECDRGWRGRARRGWR